MVQRSNVMSMLLLIICIKSCASSVYASRTGIRFLLVPFLLVLLLRFLNSTSVDSDAVLASTISNTRHTLAAYLQMVSTC